MHSPFPTLQRTKTDIEVLSGRQQTPIIPKSLDRDSISSKSLLFCYSQSFTTDTKSRCSEDLDHHLPLSLRSKSTRRRRMSVAARGCFAVFSPDFKSRFEISEKEVAEFSSIAENRLDRVSVRVGLSALKVSRSLVFNRIVDELTDDNLNHHEMGGVGKIELFDIDTSFENLVT
ncbi:hypothetical protein V6N11_071165 [Hibiscus sabdariffa]|uniref:Uncharacterized protein n=1 Tax=Hibiscus sabdariffa TaxID=183260 RepID=A0ABR2TZA7_9ROSI